MRAGPLPSPRRRKPSPSGRGSPGFEYNFFILSFLPLITPAKSRNLNTYSAENLADVLSTEKWLATT